MSSRTEIEDWITSASAVLKISDRRMDMAEAKRVLSDTQRRFVIGSPRVWWLGFAVTRSTHPSETTSLPALVDDPDARGWFIPDTEGSICLAYRLTAREAEFLVRACPYFEYYFLNARGDLLIAETDHNQFVIAAPLPAPPTGEMPPTQSGKDGAKRS